MNFSSTKKNTILVIELKIQTMSQREPKQFRFQNAISDDKQSIKNFFKLYFYPDERHQQPNYNCEEDYEFTTDCIEQVF